MIKFFVIIPSDSYDSFFQYFNCKNLCAIVLSNMFFSITAYLYLLNIGSLIFCRKIALIANVICLNVSDFK